VTGLIDRNTGLSIGLAVIIVGASLMLGRELNGIERDIAEVRKATVSIEHNAAVIATNARKLMVIEAEIEAIKVASADRYTLTAASEDAFRHAIANPGVKVPDPRHPGDFIVVDRGRVSSGPTNARPPGHTP
jgi:hypothetical protein